MKTKGKFLTTLAVSAALCLGFGVGNMTTITTDAATETKTLVTFADSDYTTSSTTLSKVSGYYGSEPNLVASFGRMQDTTGGQNIVELDGSTDGKALSYNINYWGFTYHSGVKFAEPVLATAIESITFRVYIDQKSGTTLNDNDMAWLGGSIWLYAIGDTGAAGEGYAIPYGTAQKEWVDITLSDSNVGKLADDAGYFSGFQLGTAFANAVPSNGSAFIAVDTVSVVASVVEKSEGMLTEFNGDYTIGQKTLSKVSGYYGSEPNLVASFGRMQDTTGSQNIVELDGSTDGKALSYNINYWGFTYHSGVKFAEPVLATAIESITFRVYIDQKSGTTLNDNDMAWLGGSIWLYAIGDTGAAGEGYAIPYGTAQKEWVDITLFGSNNVGKLADDAGYFSGFQLGTAFANAVPSNGSAFIAIDSVSYVEKSEMTAINKAIGAMEMTAGASIRLSEAGNGIRFETNVDKAVADEFMASELFEEVAFGTVIVPVDYLTDDATLESLRVAGKAAVLEARGFYEAVSTEDTYKFWGSLVDLRDYNYYRQFIGVGYIRTVVDGVETYTYMEYDLANARSVYEVAVAAYNDTETAYTDTQKAFIKAYIDAVVILDGTTGEYAGGLEGYTAPYSIDTTTGVITSTAVIKTVVKMDNGVASIAPSAYLEFSEDCKTVKVGG